MHRLLYSNGSLKFSLNRVLKQPLRVSSPMRAFMNGKMDLSQAEAVADIIASDSEAAHRLAATQLRERFSD
ncbi:MAG: hypothetical protein MZV63_22265 [Marinilabiliales bacterium]|nr:hypothetical protein [Marinilabiliales bacterium]